MNQQKLVILGAGESGVGAALLGKKKGYRVFVSDSGKIKPKYKDVLKHNSIEWEETKHSYALIFDADLIIKSPGIPDCIDLIKKLRKEEIPIVSEIEFASRFTNSCIIGVTGSNGKTTTTMLIYHMLKQANRDVIMAGNIGKSFANQVVLSEPELYVLELSSFQLDGIVNFAPHIAVITNITPDHLDRYDYKFENYIASKFRIALNQTKDDFLIYDHDDKTIKNYLEQYPIQSTLFPFSINTSFEFGAYLENKKIIINTTNTKTVMPIAHFTLQGNHNIKNALAASAVSQLLNIRKEIIRDSLENFQGAEHRLEHVLQINKVKYINDSKATNINATYYALESMQSPTVWIVGGQDKGNDYQQLYALVNQKVKAMICLGIDNSKLLECFSPIVDLIVETQSMYEAVKMAYRISEAGDNVLLSPACASFDLFKNYEDRGRQFKEVVRKL